MLCKDLSSNPCRQMIVGRLYQSVKQSFEALTALKDMLRHPETTLILSAAKAEVLRAGKSPGIEYGGRFSGNYSQNFFLHFTGK
jgi:hypothetical protein